MPVYKIHRLKDSQFQHFRWAPHTAGTTPVKRKDYEPAGEVEAPSVYAAWTLLRESGQPLRVGDLLEFEGGDLRICKYVGFEEAHWFSPESTPGSEGPLPDTSQASGSAEETSAKPR